MNCLRAHANISFCAILREGGETTGRGLLGVLLDVKVLQRAATDCFIRLGRVVRRCVDPRKVGAKDCGPVEMVSHTAVLEGVLGRKDGQFGLMTLICRW